MTKEILEKQLNDLRIKWKVFPKSYMEPNWWKFKCDKTKAIGLIEQIKKIEGSGTGILTPEEMEKILS